MNAFLLYLFQFSVQRLLDPLDLLEQLVELVNVPLVLSDPSPPTPISDLLHLTHGERDGTKTLLAQHLHEHFRYVEFLLEYLQFP